MAIANKEFLLQNEIIGLRNTINNLQTTQDKLMSDIITKNTEIKDLMDIIDKLNKQLERINNIEEIEEVFTEIKNYNEAKTKIVYGLNKSEYEAYNKFKEEHKNCKGKIWINIQENEIASTLTVKCSKCKKKENITDYDLW